VEEIVKENGPWFKLLLTCLLPATMLLAELPTHKLFIPGTHFVT